MPNDERPDGGSVNPAWQRVWFASLTRKWSSLAVVPSEPGVDSVAVAKNLVAVGHQHGAATVRLLNAVNASLADVQPLLRQISAAAERGELTVVALDCPSQNPAVIPIAQAASAVLLVVRARESRVNSVNKTVDAIGRERVLGSVVLD